MDTSDVAAPLHVFENDTDKVVAKDEEDAWAVWCEHTGERRSDHEEFWSWEQVPDHHEFSISFERDDPNPGLYEGLEREALPPKSYFSFCCKTTAVDWARRRGRGFLSSTEY